MPRSRFLIPLLLPWLAAAGPLPETVQSAAGEGTVANANHIFNAIHNSMRQFGSSLNHNGMSLFVATVPEGTELYHGTSREYRVNGTEWLAFEPEHALIFARPRGPPPGHHPPEGGPDGNGHPHLSNPHGQDDGIYCPDEYQRPGKHHGEKDCPGKDRPDNINGGDDRPDKHHGPPRNDSRPDYPHYPPPPSDGHPPPPPPPPPHRGPPGWDHPPPPPPPPHHGPPHEGHPPPPPHHGPPHEDFDHHGPPHEEFGDHGPPSEDVDHHGPPPPPFRGFLPHSIAEAIERHHAQEHEHHGSLSVPPVGFWVRRLGDMLRNPKRNASPPPPPAASSQPEARGAQGAFGTLFTEQEPLTEDKPISGYLHTYRTKHSLRLLYLDGQSAAKSEKGTLDTQDILLLNGDIDNDSGMFGEKDRANKMCKLAHEQWGDRIDGFLRMEGGFEVILCSFATHLDIVRIAKMDLNNDGPGPGSDSEDGFNYYRAVAARYHGIGGGRVTLDYDHFVTSFAYPEAMYFDNTSRPRLHNASAEVDVARQDVTKMVLRKGDDVGLNWQAVIDMIIERYADRIEYLASGKLKTLGALKDEIDRALRPFTDYSARDSNLEVERCAAQFYPLNTDTTTVAARAVQQVSHSLCTSLAATAKLDSYEDALESLQNLKQYLGWTTWKQCRGCGMHEVCFLPIWPIGSEEDFKQPKCRSDASMGHGDYWNDFGGPGGPHGPPHGPHGRPRCGRHDEKKKE